MPALPDLARLPLPSIDTLLHWLLALYPWFLGGVAVGVFGNLGRHLLFGSVLFLGMVGAPAYILMYHDYRWQPVASYLLGLTLASSISVAVRRRRVEQRARADIEQKLAASKKRRGMA